MTALSVFAALAALVTVGAELLLRVTTKRSAINNRKLFMMISFFNLSRSLDDIRQITY
jgi:hypothetical protein